MSKSMLDNYYANCDVRCWEYRPDREDWAISQKWIAERKNEGTVLDVGCWTGGFLSQLGQSFHKSGIEINLAAAEKATQAGITIVGRDIADVYTLEKQHDIVTAYDVIEHTANPIEFLRSLLALVKKDGFAIISTGDTAAVPWNFLKNKHGYCINAQHISFLNKAWLSYAENKLDCCVEQFERHAHHASPSLRRIMRGSVNSLFYLAAPRACALLRRGKRLLDRKCTQIVSDDTPPSWPWVSDHFIALLRNRREL